jgi:hypothetical protein
MMAPINLPGLGKKKKIKGPHPLLENGVFVENMTC